MQQAVQRIALIESLLHTVGYLIRKVTDFIKFARHDPEIQLQLLALDLGFGFRARPEIAHIAHGCFNADPRTLGFK